ncbi:hypothetical protein GQX74_002375 [Glossina fuscipes]|nr:hypothetical protein GQX74_002375 [Glossina fuscipes]
MKSKNYKGKLDLVNIVHTLFFSLLIVLAKCFAIYNNNHPSILRFVLPLWYSVRLLHTPNILACLTRFPDQTCLILKSVLTIRGFARTNNSTMAAAKGLIDLHCYIDAGEMD